MVISSARRPGWPGGGGCGITCAAPSADVRRIVDDLRPAVLDDLGLAEALRARANQFSMASGLRSVAAGQAVFGTGVADRILKQLTDPPRGKAPTSGAFPQLTEREIEILGLLAHGLSNHAISTRLHISDKTVRNHVSNILTKTGAPDRHAAAEMARQAGLGFTPSG